MEKFCISFIKMADKVSQVQGEQKTKYEWSLRKKTKFAWKYMK